MSRCIRRGSCLLLLVFLTLINAASAAAGVSSKKSKATAAFRNFLNSSKYTFFRTFDVNGDGVNELICGNGADCYFSGNIWVYQYRNGKVKLCGHDTAMTGFQIRTVKKGKQGIPKKCLEGSWIRHLSADRWYYKINKAGKLVKVSILAAGSVYNGEKTTYRFHYYGKKEISLTKYNALVQEWKRGAKALRLYSRTQSNIIRYAVG